MLTYNLLVHGEARATTLPAPAAGTVDALVTCLNQHFTTPVPAPVWSRADDRRDSPNRLVYLLDHEYTPKALS